MTTKNYQKMRIDANNESLNNISREIEKLSNERAFLMQEKKRIETLIGYNSDKTKILKRHANMLNEEIKSFNKNQ